MIRSTGELTESTGTEYTVGAVGIDGGMDRAPDTQHPIGRPLIFTATYNEADNIEALVGDCLAVAPAADMLVVDDNSPDGTGAILDRLARQHSGRLTVLHRPRKLGLGTAHRLALVYALVHDYDVLITMDADFSHHPRDIPEMLARLRTADFVIGSRYAPGGRCDYGFVRTVISRSANVCARLLLGLRLNETTTSFRGFTRRTLQLLPIGAIRSDGYSFFFESLFLTAQVVPSLVEFPIHFEDRRAGTSKISKREIGNGILNLVRLFFVRVRSRRVTLSTVASPPRDPCRICGNIYHVERQSATAHRRSAEPSRRTTSHHTSHGRIVQCLSCGLVYTSPRSTSDAIA